MSWFMCFLVLFVLQVKTFFVPNVSSFCLRGVGQSSFHYKSLCKCKQIKWKKKPCCLTYLKKKLCADRCQVIVVTHARGVVGRYCYFFSQTGFNMRLTSLWSQKSKEHGSFHVKLNKCLPTSHYIQNGCNYCPYNKPVCKIWSWFCDWPLICPYD